MGRCGGDRLIVYRCGGNPGGFRCPPCAGSQASRDSPGGVARPPKSLRRSRRQQQRAVLQLRVAWPGMYIRLFLNYPFSCNSSRSMSVMSRLLHSHLPLQHHHHLQRLHAHPPNQRKHHPLLAYPQPLSLLLLLCMRRRKSHCRLYSR
jgi:hypothetical protein